MDQNYKDTLYITPDEAGETYIYSKDKMLSTLNDLEKECGYTFALSDCTEIYFVSKKQDFAIYATTKSKNPQQVKILKKDNQFKFEWI